MMESYLGQGCVWLSMASVLDVPAPVRGATEATYWEESGVSGGPMAGVAGRAAAGVPAAESRLAA